MITIKGRFLTYGEIWFNEQPPQRPGVDVLMFRLRPEPITGSRYTPFLSLANDLTADAETLKASFGKTNRYKIHRAEIKDELEAEFFEDCRPHLDSFCGFYDSFADQKCLQRLYRRELQAACEAGQLVLTSAKCRGQVLVWHAYIRLRDTAALLHSASHFRAHAAADRAVVGRANRWLHWRDMLEFKRLGLNRYDWGGMFDDEKIPAQASINAFKREFGGIPVHHWNCTLPMTLKGRSYLSMQRGLHRND